MDKIQQLYQLSKDFDILFVEDDDGLRLQMGRVFDELFNQVDTAQNGKVGLQRYRDRLDKTHSPYDLVITDINMPEMNGIEMIHEIYTLNPLQPVIVVSAHNESEYLIELLHIGISNFLIKPIRHEELITTLYKVIQAIINERLIEKYYQEIEELNAKLILQDEALKKSNEALHEKNIALEKSMRIIEGMQHKDGIHRQMTIPIRSKRSIEVDDTYTSTTSSHLKKIDRVINSISSKLLRQPLEQSTLDELCNAVKDYTDALPEEKVFKGLHSKFRQLGSTLSQQPMCDSVEEFERIFSMLESFFFIYSKWEQEWKNIDKEKFALLSSSIEDEIDTLIDVWYCRV